VETPVSTAPLGLSTRAWITAIPVNISPIDRVSAAQAFANSLRVNRGTKRYVAFPQVCATRRSAIQISMSFCFPTSSVSSHSI